MANSRPTSMILPSSVLDEINTNESKQIIQKKESLSIRSSNQQKLPVNHIAIAHSSSSSIDSTGAKTVVSLEKTPVPQINSLATVSSTTTDSELESEQEERYTDDNNSLESTNLPTQRRQQQQTHRRENRQSKSDGNTSEQLSRREKHFQKLFKSEIAEDDMPELIDSYVCAYQGDILLQGKMYITNRYLCFHSRIISYVTKHVYRWEQIQKVTKERVAFIFPTAIGIQLKPSDKKIIYASFLQRDQAFDKIISISSCFTNDTTSLLDDDNDDDIRLSNHGGTLKATQSNRSSNVKLKNSKRNNHCGIPDEIEHDNVLQMCLKQDRTNNNNNNNNNKHQRLQSISSKSSDDKQQQQQQSKKILNSDKKTSNLKKSNINQNLTNDFNQNLSQYNETHRQSHNSKTQQKQTDIIPDDPVVYRQLHNTHRSLSRDRTSLPIDRTSSNISHSNSPSGLTTNNDSSTANFNNDGFLKKYSRTIILSVISIIKLIMEYLILLYNQFKTYPIKTSLILLIFVSILIIHSFYLIKLAYRIENRLQSLHTAWPSSSMKNSPPSLKEL